LIVYARKGNAPASKTEKTIAIPDNKQSEITINLDSALNPPKQ